MSMLNRDANTPKLIKFLAVLALVISFVTGYIMGYYNNSSFSFNKAKPSKVLSGEADTFQAGWLSARKKLDKSGFFAPGTVNIQSLSGNIKETRENSFLLSTGLLHPLDDDTLKERVVKITENTKIIIKRNLTEAERATWEKEREEKMEVLKNKLLVSEKGRKFLELQERVGGSVPLAASGFEELNELKMDGEAEKLIRQYEELFMFPAPNDIFKEETGELKDLKAGNYVVVSTDKNISQEKEFVAKRIIFEEYMYVAIPAPVPVETATP